MAVGRITRRWNQTGQKFAGSPDIAKTFLGSHRGLLWTSVLLAYAVFASKLVARSASRRLYHLTTLTSITTLAGVSFKIAFTEADSPELLSGSIIPHWVLGMVNRLSLVVQARAVFLGLLVSFAIDFIENARKGPGKYLSSYNHLQFLSSYRAC